MLFLILLIFGQIPLFSDSISITSNPAALTINSAVAGQAPLPVSDSSTSYSVATTTVVRVITGKVNSALPTGVTLQIQLGAPAGSTSSGSVAMTTTAKNLITNIPKNTTASSLTITYTLSATASAVPQSNVTRTITLTLQ